MSDLGPVAIHATELPNPLGVTLTSTAPVVLALTCAGLVLFLGAGIHRIVIAVRLAAGSITAP